MDIDIKYIAKLSRISINSNDEQKFRKNMQEIVDMVNGLPEINEELALDKNNAMILRDDIAETGKFSREELMKNAPEVQAGCLVVPKTVE
ncbi:MAG: Asp-tRNA(Asn)/Glu-tRNA(Gln) amidotransferase subunit GatC [Oscillospiraceae bacterium]